MGGGRCQDAGQKVAAVAGSVGGGRCQDAEQYVAAVAEDFGLGDSRDDRAINLQAVVAALDGVNGGGGGSCDDVIGGGKVATIGAHPILAYRHDWMEIIR